MASRMCTRACHVATRTWLPCRIQIASCGGAAVVPAGRAPRQSHIGPQAMPPRGANSGGGGCCGARDDSRWIAACDLCCSKPRRRQGLLRGQCWLASTGRCKVIGLFHCHCENTLRETPRKFGKLAESDAFAGLVYHARVVTVVRFSGRIGQVRVR